jgi:hypothetical protein
MAAQLDQLEATVLEALGRQEPALAHLWQRLTVSDREHTGVGRFTTFVSGAADPSVPDQVVGLGAVIEAPALKHGIGASVTIAKGRVEFLELVSFGGETWGPELEDFTVRPA